MPPNGFSRESGSPEWWYLVSIQIEELDRSTIEEITSDWPEKPTKLTDRLVERYGLPHEVTTERFFWHDVGEWKRVQVYRDGTPHDFPKEHEDHLRQTIDYPIDPEDAEDLVAFDGSNVLYRTRGELAADCHKETMNKLTLNLAHDILTGEKSVEEARQAFAEIAIREMMGTNPAYTLRLQFDVPEGDQGYPDETIVTDTLKEDVRETVKGIKEPVEDATGGS